MKLHFQHGKLSHKSARRAYLNVPNTVLWSRNARHPGPPASSEKTDPMHSVLLLKSGETIPTAALPLPAGTGNKAA